MCACFIDLIVFPLTIFKRQGRCMFPACGLRNTLANSDVTIVFSFCGKFHYNGTCVAYWAGIWFSFLFPMARTERKRVVTNKQFRFRLLMCVSQADFWKWNLTCEFIFNYFKARISSSIVHVQVLDGVCLSTCLLGAFLDLVFLSSFQNFPAFFFFFSSLFL